MQTRVSVYRTVAQNRRSQSLVSILETEATLEECHRFHHSAVGTPCPLPNGCVTQELIQGNRRLRLGPNSKSRMGSMCSNTSLFATSSTRKTLNEGLHEDLHNKESTAGIEEPEMKIEA